MAVAGFSNRSQFAFGQVARTNRAMMRQKMLILASGLRIGPETHRY
jgi:hypothetical protein